MAARHNHLIAGLFALTAFLVPATAAAADWTPAALLAQRSDVQFDLSLGADGTAAAAWQRGGVHVVVKRPGRPWSAPRRVSDPRRLCGRPAVAVTGRGEVIVAWPQAVSPSGATLIRGPLTIRGRARGTSGTWGAVRTLGDTAHFIDAGIDLAANARGETIALWRGLRRRSPGRRADAVQAAFRRPLTPFGHAQTIRDPGRARTAVSGQVVALDELGIAHAAWSSGSTPVVRLASRTRGGRGSWHAPRTIGGRPSSNPAIATGGDRSVTIAWRAARLDSEGSGIQSGALDVRTRHTSGALTGTQRVSDEPVRSHRLATGSLGRAVLTWTTLETDPPTPAASGIRIATRTTAGGRFDVPEVIAGVQPGVFHGGPVMLADGTVLLAWSDSARTRVIARSATGSLAATYELDLPGVYPLTAAAGDRVAIVWNRLSGNDVGLQASTLLRAAR